MYSFRVDFNKIQEPICKLIPDVVKKNQVISAAIVAISALGLVYSQRTSISLFFEEFYASRSTIENKFKFAQKCYDSGDRSRASKYFSQVVASNVSDIPPDFKESYVTALLYLEEAYRDALDNLSPIDSIVSKHRDLLEKLSSFDNLSDLPESMRVKCNNHLYLFAIDCQSDDKDLENLPLSRKAFKLILSLDYSLLKDESDKIRYINALFAYANMCEQGLGGDIDYHEAIAHYDELAAFEEEVLPKAVRQLKYHSLYSTAEIRQDKLQNSEDSAFLFGRIASLESDKVSPTFLANYYNATYRCANLCADENEMEEAAQYFEKIASMDYSEVPEEAKESYFGSLFAIGHIYEEGTGVEIADKSIALSYYEKLNSISEEEFTSADAKAFQQIAKDKIVELKAMKPQGVSSTARSGVSHAFLSMLGF